MAVSGYRQIYLPDYYCANKLGFVAEHKYVAEQKLGRRLKKGEFVHHIDRNSLNNDPDNIIVFKSKADHDRYHAGGTLEQLPDGAYISNWEKVKRACEFCGRIFTPKTASQKYCCKECVTLSKRKYDRPTRIQLKRMLLEFSVAQVATIYGVSSNILVNWCKTYRLPWKLKDLKKMREREQEREDAKRRQEEEKKRQKESDQLRRENEAY